MNKDKRSLNKNTVPLKGLDPKRAGIDIGASSVFVCISDANGRQEVREYSTFTRDLISMAEWLKAHRVVYRHLFLQHKFALIFFPRAK